MTLPNENKYKVKFLKYCININTKFSTKSKIPNAK